ncbi:hypothetical protein PENANT_c043G00841 [Penicillium antarcticum]|uniref:Uncharacterized protein n=1 Tax=Penicillium antarcticum TaxID=416450 RepID=A0A1V6PSB2_9EURO|nr:hypothetical protein PENANT_c043G00841 [Penicillium antarcticum]
MAVFTAPRFHRPIPEIIELLRRSVIDGPNDRALHVLTPSPSVRAARQDSGFFFIARVPQWIEEQRYQQWLVEHHILDRRLPALASGAL